MYKRINELLGTNYKSNNEINWESICLSEKINEEFVEEFRKNMNYLSWGYISMNPNLTENFIRRYNGFLNFKNISSNSVLSESFIEEFSDKLNWSVMSSHQYLTERLMEKYVSKIPWGTVSQYQPMSEEFIRKYEDRVNWSCISAHQLLSWDFILEFKDRLDWGKISIQQPYINSEYERIDKELLKDNNLYYLYQETKDRGWFIGYMNPFDYERRKEICFFFLKQLSSSWDYSLKFRVYWKDLVKLNYSRRVEKNFIRKIKYV